MFGFYVIAVVLSICMGICVGGFLLCVMNICEKKNVPENRIGLIMSIVWCVIFALLIRKCAQDWAEAKNAEKEKVVKFETKSAPQIDTLISIKNGIADTTYVYNFKEK